MQRDVTERSSNKSSFLAISTKKELLLLLLYILSLCALLFSLVVYSTLPFLFFCGNLDEKRIMQVQTALQYKPLYNINRSEKQGNKYTNRGLY